VFGPGSPEAMHLAADPSRFKDPETADYVGVTMLLACRLLVVGSRTIAPH
jgi:hypothetical protein